MKQFFLTMGGVFAGLVMFFVFLPIAALTLIIATAHPAPTPQNSILTLDLRERLPDQASRSPFAFLSGHSLSVTEIAQTLRAAETDPHVKALLVRLPEGGMAPAAADEVRAALRHFSKSGKMVIAHSQGLYPSGFVSAAYMVGASADQFWMQPKASLQAVGVSSETMFFKRFFDRYGLKADFEQRYEYKNAVNPYLHDDFTPAHREATLGYMTAIYASELGLAAQDRKQDPSKLRATLEAGPYDAETAKSLGLIDKVGDVTEAEASLKGLVSDGEAHMLDFASYHPPKAAPADAKIAIINAEGDIITGSGGAKGFGGAESIYSDEIASAFHQAIEDKAVKAIVFRVSSPGGSDTASEEIGAAVKAAKAAGKPVIVSMGTYAASGGYWISASASEIIADPTTLTGSIGVFGGKLALGPALARFGIDTRETTVGSDYAAAFGSGHGFTPSQRAALSSWMDHIYEAFIKEVSDGRKLPLARVRELAKGRVWTGVQAKERGLVDQLGGFDLALAEARRLAKIAPDEAVSLEDLPSARSPFASFGQGARASLAFGRAALVLGQRLDDPRVQTLIQQLDHATRSPRDTTVLAPEY